MPQPYQPPRQKQNDSNNKNTEDNKMKVRQAGCQDISDQDKKHGTDDGADDRAYAADEGHDQRIKGPHRVECELRVVAHVVVSKGAARQSGKKGADNKSR